MSDSGYYHGNVLLQLVLSCLQPSSSDLGLAALRTIELHLGLSLSLGSVTSTRPSCSADKPVQALTLYIQAVFGLSRFLLPGRPIIPCIISFSKQPGSF